jgi:hypothetical protein
LKVRSPWPVRRNPVYAIAAVQRITRTGCIGNYLYRRAGERARMRSGRKQLRNKSPSSSRERECVKQRYA